MGKKPELESVHLVNHSKCMLAAFQNFRQDETMLDVTLVCKGMSLKAHKLVLSACSPFLKELFAENPCKHPIVILRHFEFADLKAIIDFIYKGELSVPRERLMSALKVAEELQIRGLRSSEPNKEKYEKLYNKVCGKISSRKKRKRRHNSSDSDEKGYVEVSESDQNVESDESVVRNRKETLESQPMDVESADMEKSSDNDKDVRPVVLRVGDVSTSNEDSVSRNALDEEECNLVNSEEKNLVGNESSKDNISATQEEIEGDTYEPASENMALSSQFDCYDDCVENSNSKFAPEDEQNSFQEQPMEPVTTTECLDEQTGFMSSCLSPKMSEVQGSDESKFQDEGKRFVCSKCDSVFTSRINFMRHKTLGHNTVERSSYKCQHCSFTTEEMDCLKSHLLTHSEKVPYTCSTCSEEFASEELYKKHLTLHEIEEITLHRFSSSSSGQELLSQTEKKLEFRCSICFLKFSSKLRCQFHEKTCQGGS